MLAFKLSKMLKTRNTSVLNISVVAVLVAAAISMSPRQMNVYANVDHGNNEKNCPIIAYNCVCEDSSSGGYNIFCPNRQFHTFVVHYKSSHELFLKCNTRGLDGEIQHSTDIIYQLKNLTVQNLELFQIMNCPIPSSSISIFTDSMKSTGLKGLHIVYGRFDEGIAKQKLITNT